MREHRVGLEGDGTRKGLNRLEVTFGRDGLVARGNLALEFPFVGESGVGKSARHAGHGHEDDRHQGSTHGTMVAKRSELSERGGF